MGSSRLGKLWWLALFTSGLISNNRDAVFEKTASGSQSPAVNPRSALIRSEPALQTHTQRLEYKCGFAHAAHPPRNRLLSICCSSLKAGVSAEQEPWACFEKTKACINFICLCLLWLMLSSDALITLCFFSLDLSLSVVWQHLQRLGADRSLGLLQRVQQDLGGGAFSGGGAGEWLTPWWINNSINPIYAIGLETWKLGLFYYTMHQLNNWMNCKIITCQYGLRSYPQIIL